MAEVEVLCVHPLCTFTLMRPEDRAEVAALVTDAHYRLSPLVQALKLERAEVEDVLTKFINGLDLTTCVVAREPLSGTLVYCTVLMPMSRLNELTFGGALSPMDELDDLVLGSCPGTPDQILLGDLASIHAEFEGRGIAQLGAAVHIQRARALGLRYAGGVAIHPANERIWRRAGAVEYDSAWVQDFAISAPDGQVQHPFAGLSLRATLLLVDVEG